MIITSDKPAKPVELNESTFEATIQKGVVLVDWWAPWCGPCCSFAPIFEQAAARSPDVTFAKVNTEQAPRLAAEFGIQAIPTLMVFKDGVLVFAQPGMLPAAALDDLVTQAKALDMDKVHAEIAAAEARTKTA